MKKTFAPVILVQKFFCPFVTMVKTKKLSEDIIRVIICKHKISKGDKCIFQDLGNLESSLCGVIQKF